MEIGGWLVQLRSYPVDLTVGQDQDKWGSARGGEVRRMRGVNITVSRSLGVPLVTQIRDQIRCAISVGDLRAGERLPTIRQLAEFLGINRNTVGQAYRLLELEGHVVTRAGGGTTVADNPAVHADSPATALRSIVRSAVNQAMSAGFTAQEFAELAYHESAHYKSVPATRIVVIDEYRGELEFVCATIRRALPDCVVEAFLVAGLQACDPVERRRRLAHFDCALVAFYCLENVQPMLAAVDLPVLAAGIGPSLNSLRRIADECVGKRVAIVCTESNGPAHMEAALRRVGITFSVGPVHAHVRHEQLAQILSTCDVVIASQGAAAVVSELARGQTVIPYSRLISEESLATLRSYTDRLARQVTRNPHTAASHGHTPPVEWD